MAHRLSLSPGSPCRRKRGVQLANRAGEVTACPSIDDRLRCFGLALQRPEQVWRRTADTKAFALPLGKCVAILRPNLDALDERVLVIVFEFERKYVLARESRCDCKGLLGCIGLDLGLGPMKFGIERNGVGRHG